MIDHRMCELADQLLTSVRLQAGDNILIETTDVPPEMTMTLQSAAVMRGANPTVHMYDSGVEREYELLAPKCAKDARAAHDLAEMKTMQAYIAIRGSKNSYETSDIPSHVSTEYKQIRRPVTRYRVDNTKWCVTRWPNSAMAQEAKMSTTAFEDFYFNACLVNYELMRIAVQPLVGLMNGTDNVHIVAPGTDLTFSIKGIPAIPCCGEMNIPDGEVYTAPVKDSVNGHVTFNAPTVYLGKAFGDIRLDFTDGKITSATCGSGDPVQLNDILDTDEGARFIGEFALGLNPKIERPMCDILFDEKIAGSFHFTPGNAYQDAWNGNRSAIHWDMVRIMRPDYPGGGGKIWFDGELVQEDGKFVHPQLMHVMST